MTQEIQNKLKAMAAVIKTGLANRALNMNVSNKLTANVINKLEGLADFYEGINEMSPAFARSYVNNGLALDIYELKVFLNPDGGKAFPDYDLQQVACSLLQQLELLSPTPVSFSPSTKQRSVSFSEVNDFIKVESNRIERDEDEAQAKWRQDKCEVSQNVKRVLSYHEHKADPNETDNINLPVANLIEKLSDLEKIFDDEQHSREELETKVFPNFIARLSAIIHPTSGENFPDRALKEQTKMLIKNLGVLTPPQGRMFAKQKQSRYITHSFESLASSRPSINTNDDPCCSLNPSKSCVIS